MDKMETYNRFAPYYKRAAICVSGREDHDSFIQFVTEHPTFVKKIVSESCGNGTELIDLLKMDTLPDEFFCSLQDGQKYILEERVIQSSVMSKLNDSSVNTVRCFTLNTYDGVVVPWCFLKVGRKGSFVDNGGAGGILIGIDTECGRLNTDGVDEYGLRYSVHPDSLIPFKGYLLPEWNRLLNICKELGGKVKKVGWIGWDLAHTDQGWVIIEGNAVSEVIGPQSTSGRGIRAELDRYIQNMDLFM